MNITVSAPKPHSGSFFSGMLLGVFCLTLFLSAALMFAIQPMTGKMLLPIVGGTPAGWIVAMAFFQIMLLVGYFLAHILSKFSPRLHAVLYIGALAAGIYFMPIDIRTHAHTMSKAPQPMDIFILLSATLGIPFIALSATSSTIQRLFTATSHASAADPYFLYVASNLGSFAGLLLYPVAFEPILTLSEQSGYSSLAYSLLIAAGTLCLLLSLASKRENKKNDAPDKSLSASEKVGTKRYLQWMTLSLIPSSLLLGVTIYITTDIMSVPMIWVLPLCLYLLTFIIAFSNKTFIRLNTLQDLMPIVVLASVFLICTTQMKFLNQWTGIFFYLGVFFLVAQACHLKLASLRPLGHDSRHLTGFYLMMSVGGALGGILNAFIIPQIADRLIEFPLMLVAALFLHPAFNPKNLYGKIAIAALVLTTLTLYKTPPQFALSPAQTAEIIVTLIGALMIIMFVTPSARRFLHRESLITASAVLLFAAQFLILETNTQHTDRNFYGTIRVYDSELMDDKGNSYIVKFIRHGTTTHGAQIISPAERQTEQTSYYNKDGPLGEIFRAHPPKRVAAIGLGAGVVNCYSAPDRHFTFFEIDPAVVEVAQKYFTFLSACKSADEPRIIVGDGRLELNRLSDEKFDLVIVDAFSSDSIPVHLLTREAAQDYLKRTADDGIIAFHVSNRYFSLEKQIAEIAKDLDLKLLYKFDRKADKPVRYPSIWVILSRKDFSTDLTEAEGWITLPDYDHRIWTDDYSNILSALFFAKPKQ